MPCSMMKTTISYQISTTDSRHDDWLLPVTPSILLASLESQKALTILRTPGGTVEIRRAVATPGRVCPGTGGLPDLRVVLPDSVHVHLHADSGVVLCGRSGFEGN